MNKVGHSSAKTLSVTHTKKLTENTQGKDVEYSRYLVFVNSDELYKVSALKSNLNQFFQDIFEVFSYRL